MMSIGKAEIICDLAEYYHILNYNELSPELVATLVLGLRDDSRIKMKLSGYKLNTNQMLMAVMVDNLQFLSWTKTKQAQKNQGRPESVLNKLLDLDKPKDELMSFESVEEFEQWMNCKSKEYIDG